MSFSDSPSDISKKVKDFYNNVFAMKRLSVYNISSKEKKQIINEIRILKYNICPYLIKLVE